MRFYITLLAVVAGLSAFGSYRPTHPYLDLSTNSAPPAYRPGRLYYDTNNQVLAFTTGRSTNASITISTNVALDFPSTVAGAVSDLIVTIPNVSTNGTWVVQVSPDLAVMTGTSMNLAAIAPFKVYVSGKNAVTVRFSNNHASTAVDPPAGKFSITATKTAAD